MLGMLTMFVNNSIINVLLPTLIRELEVSLSTAQWLSNGFITVCGILIPVSAYLVKRFSYKRIFITAQIVFIIGSAICGMAKSFTPLLIGRLVQSVGSGLAIPLVLNILVSIFPVEKRGSVMGIYSLGIVLAPALGPSIGGLVIQYHSWNVLFWGMTIVAVVIFVGTLFFLSIENKTEKCRFDVGGFILSALGCGTLLYGVSQRQLIFIVPALAILVVFWFYEQKRKGDALLNLSVLRNVQFTYALIINVIFTINMYAGMLLLPHYIQNIRGLSLIHI
jgi:EmrB/QacA subfamily drug resistance transporter